MVKNRHHQDGVERGPGDCYQWKAKGQCSKGDNCSFRHDGNKQRKWTPTSAPPSEPQPEKNGEKSSRRKSLRRRSLCEKLTRTTCRDYIKGKCTRPSCDSWHYPECQYHKKPSGCRFGDKCAVMHQQADGQTCNKPKQQSDEGAVAFLKDSRLLRCVFQDVEPPKFSSILQKSTAVSRPADTVQFSTNTLRHVKIRETKVHRLV